MPLGNILLCANGLGNFSNQLSLSLTLGERFASHVQVLAFRPQYAPFMSPADMTAADGGAEAANVAAREVDDGLDQRKRVFDDLVSIARAEGSSTKTISATWEDVHAPMKAALPSYARACDVIVSGGTSDDNSTSTLDDDVSRIALLESGRPVLFAGDHAAGNLFRRVLIAWNDGVPASRAVGYALPLVALADEVCLFAVESDPGRATPVNQVLSYLRAHAPQTTVRAERSALHTIGHAILDQAETMQASLIVMGAYEHSRNRELLFGGTTRHIIQHARSPVFIST